MIVVYIDKSNAAGHFFKQVQEHYLQHDPEQKIVFISAQYFNNISYQYPRNIAWSQFPCIQYPDFKINDIEHWLPKTIVDNELVDCELSWDEIDNCDELLYMGEPNYSSYIFSVFVDKMENIKNIKACVITTYADVSLNEKNDFSIYMDKNKYGEVVHYFNYNFNFNSFAIFGKLLKQFEVNDMQMSKYMLQTMYYLADKSLCYTEGTLIYAMSQWKGTGKYNEKVELGSPASRTAIIENLYSLGFLSTNEIEGKDYIYITRRGQAFLGALPKDCMDQDLPFRIKHWAENGLDNCRDNIDTYLYQYFSKIKRRIQTHQMLGL